nr:cupredoxin domain-containing protein [Ramlibacter sp.]
MSFQRVIAPIPFAVAVLFISAPLIGSVGATAVAKAAANKPAAAAPANQGTVHRIVLKTGMAGGKMVYLDEKGTVNPTLRGKVGDTVEITITSGEGAQHDIVFDGIAGAKSAMFDGKSAPTKLSFKLTQSGKFTYFCSVPGHRQIGMEGVIEVTGPADASAAKPAVKPATATVGAAPAAGAIAPASTK